MQVAGFLGFFIVYTQMFLLNANPECPVEVTNDLFNNPGWIKWVHQTDLYNYMYIIEHWMDFYETFYLDDLLRPSMNGRIVTKGNVERKIRQAYQFLSCKFAKVLDEFCVYERGMGTACSRMDNSFKAFQCLDILMKTFGKSDPLVMCMQGSLASLHRLSPQSYLDTEVFEILEDLKDYYRNITFDGSSSIAEEDYLSTVAEEVADVEKQVLTTLKRVRAFYNSNCRPIPWELYGQTHRTENTVNYINKNDGPDMAKCRIERYVTRNIIDSFMNSFNGKFGFNYNAETTKTVLMYDPDLIQRVDRMNEVLAKPAWSELNKADIAWNGDRVAKELLTIADGKKIVTKTNVDDKTQEAHRLLSCTYAMTLKKCCDYTKLLWKLFNDHSSNPSTYLDTMSMSEPLISRMKNALFHFYELSPHIEYKKNVYLLLENFSNSFRTEVIKEKSSLDRLFIRTKSDKKIVKRNLDIENDMNNISKKLIAFFMKNCSDGNIAYNEVLAENAGVTSTDLKEKFEQEIIDLMPSTYEAYGFPFDTTSKIKNKHIIKNVS